MSGFADRHIGPRPDERDKMLAALGLGSLEDLVAQAMPAGIRMQAPLDLPAALSETEALTALRDLGAATGLGFSVSEHHGGWLVLDR